MGSGEDLVFVNADGETFTATNLLNRDEVFTQIIGYSSVRWQVIG